LQVKYSWSYEDYFGYILIYLKQFLDYRKTIWTIASVDVLGNEKSYRGGAKDAEKSISDKKTFLGDVFSRSGFKRI